MTISKSDLISAHTRDDVCMAVIDNCNQIITGEAHKLVNSVVSLDDARMELISRCCYVVDYMYRKGVAKKTIKDACNIAVRAIINHAKNLKQYYSIRPDSSIACPKIADSLNDDEEDKIKIYGTTDDCSNLIMTEEMKTQFLLFLLTNGWAEEYVIFREMMSPSKPVLDKFGYEPTIMEVCSVFGINKDYAKIIKERLQILASLFGINGNLPKFKPSYLMGNGIIPCQSN